MSMRIKIPADYESVGQDDLLPSIGEHVVRVQSAEEEPESDVIRVRFKVVDGEDQGLTAAQRYTLTHPVGLWAFKQLMEAVGVKPENDEIDVDAAIGQELVVKITHSKSKDGERTFANVTEPRPNF
jgi:hypothetical protein